jgi:hypothetical protein
MKRLIAVVLFAACGGPAATKPAVATAPSRPAPAAVPTTAEQVIEASIAKEGGRAVLERMTSLHMIGSLKIPQLGVPGKLETFSTPPNNTFTHFEIPNVIVEDSGVIGEIAWEKNTLQGARLLTGNEKSMALRDAWFNGDLMWKKLYPKAELKGVVKFADVDCYQVELTADDGQSQTRYYTTDTLLPIGLEMVSDSPMGKVPIKVVSSDWRSENGFLYPHKITRVEAAQSIDISIDKIETNVPIPAATFELGDDIKALVSASTK